MTLAPYLAHFRITMKEQTRYFFSDSLISSISVLIHVCVVLLFYQATGVERFFAMFTWSMLVWYIIATQLIKGIQSDIILTVSRDVQTGEIASRMNKPYHYTYALLFGHVAFSLMQTVSSIIFLLPLGILWAGMEPLTALGTAALFVVGAYALLLDFFISLAIGMIALWTEDAKPYRWIYSKLVFIFGGVIFPLDILPSTLQAIAKVLPPAFIIYYPARLFVDFSWDVLVTALIGLSAYTLLFGAIALLIYKRGIRRLSTNGG